jgi:putative pyruvate formate lyase activating enzyme
LPIAAICNHRGEEPVISGTRGICNVFFAHCNLQCVYCQNHQISRNCSEKGSREITLSAAVCKIEELLDRGAHGVGFVSPSHCLEQMTAIMAALEARGRQPRYVYNSNGYDRVEAIALLAGRIGVFLPDFKYMDPELSRGLSDAPDYPEAAGAALKEMFRQKGAEIALSDDGTAVSGLIIRHLVLPGQVANSKEVLRFIAEELSTDIHLSLMSQYCPTPAVDGHPCLDRTLTAAEYDEVIEEFERLGFHRGWLQELSSSKEYRPDFDQEEPFGD